MSYLSILQIRYPDDPLDIDDIGDLLLPSLDKMYIAHSVIDDLRDAFDDGEAEIYLPAGMVIDLVELIADLVPEVPFEARCLGETLRDTWIRTYENGLAIFEVGPWDYE